MIFVDSSGQVRESNPAARAALDFGESLHLKDVVSLEKSFQFDSELVLSLVGNDENVYGRHLKDPEGNQSDVTFDVINVDRNKGKARLKLIHIKDFTPSRSYERWKDEMISMVAHEIKNPLFALKNSLNIMLANGPGPVNDDHHNFLSTSIRSIDRLTRLLDGFLDVSRISSGNYTLDSDWVNVGEFLNEVVGSFKTIFNLKSPTINIQISPEIDMIYIDAPKLEQVLFNLLSNALKFTHRDGHIQVNVVPSSMEVLSDEMRILPWHHITNLRFVRISVRDNGIGMSESTLAHLFTRYHREEGRRAMKGSHLGLSISKTLVEAQHGKLEIESQLGVGTEVMVSLPEDERTAQVITRMKSIERCLTSAVTSNRAALVYALRKEDRRDWEELVKDWPVRPRVNPSTECEREERFHLWALSKRVALALFVDDREKVDVDALFGPNRSGDHAWARDIDDYWIGRSRFPDDGSRPTRLINTALRRMKDPSTAWSKS